MKRSESTSTIYKALAAFQRDVENVAASATNPAFKSRYARLDTLLDVVRPALAKHGLCVLQDTQGDGQTVQVVTHIGHEGGEWIESEPLVLKADKATPQGQGSAITYGRRYQLAAMLGVADDKDDDGNAAEPAPAKYETRKAAPAPPPPSPPQPLTITPEQKADIIREATAMYGLEVAKGIIADAMGQIGLHRLQDLPSSEYDWFRSQIAGHAQQQPLPWGE